MKVLTVGASPYLLVRNGRINADIIRRLRSEGHEVASAVWHHDEGFFLPDDIGISYYEDDSTGEEICQLYPFLPKTSQSEGQLYELMKKIQPNLVISIGDYKDVDFIYSIKAMYPNLFKWVAIFPIDCLWVNENHRERIEYADYVISTSNFGWANLSNICNVDGDCLPYGPDHNIFSYTDRPKKDSPMLMASAQNAQPSNLAAFIKALAQSQNLMDMTGERIFGKIHTNLYDPGDYDLELLINRYGAKNVSLPDYYCSIKDGLSSKDYAAQYVSSDFFVETSARSATALTMLEAMATGCVPIGMNVGRVGEIISLMPEEYQIFVPFESFVGAHAEEYAVISIEGLVEKILDAKRDVFDDYPKFQEASISAQKVAKRFSNREFLDSFMAIIERITSRQSPISLESF